MPRAKRTSARPNRTDLQVAPAAPTQAPAAPTGMTYGAHNDTIEAQNQIPLPASPPPGAGQVPQAPGPGGGNFPAALQQALGMSVPEQMMGAPTTRPDEPITTGLSSGPGPGPAPTPPTRAADFLAQLASVGQDPAMADLAALARDMSA